MLGSSLYKQIPGDWWLSFRSVIRHSLHPLLVGVRGDLLRNQFAVAASSRIIIRSVFVSHLAAWFAPAVLSTLDESGIPVHANDSVVQPGAVDVAHRIFGIISQIVFDETEAARRLLEFVQAHYDATNVAAPGEQLMDLFFGSVEG